MVFQNVYLSTILLKQHQIWKPDATHEEVEAAAKRACCHDFISALPDGTIQSSVREALHFPAERSNEFLLPERFLKMHLLFY